MPSSGRHVCKRCKFCKAEVYLYSSSAKDFERWGICPSCGRPQGDVKRRKGE